MIFGEMKWEISRLKREISHFISFKHYLYLSLDEKARYFDLKPGPGNSKL